MTKIHTTGSSVARHDGRSADQLRSIKIERRYTELSAGSVLVSAGKTVVLCTANIEESVPPWLQKGNEPPTKGWLTAEYNMLPGSTSPRKPRERSGKVDGRTTEIQRLIGRSLRAVVDLAAFGPRTITVDCDVLQADGGTRTLSITGGFVALVDACLALRRKNPELPRPIRDSIAAVSVGEVAGQLFLDLNYQEDSRAEVDMNVIMTGSGQFVEVQGTAEGKTFSRQQLNAQLDLAEQGIRTLTLLQRDALGDDWPL